MQIYGICPETWQSRFHDLIGLCDGLYALTFTVDSLQEKLPTVGFSYVAEFSFIVFIIFVTFADCFVYFSNKEWYFLNDFSFFPQNPGRKDVQRVGDIKVRLDET